MRIPPVSAEPGQIKDARRKASNCFSSWGHNGVVSRPTEGLGHHERGRRTYVELVPVQPIYLLRRRQARDMG